MAGVRVEGVHVRDSGWRARYDFCEHHFCSFTMWVPGIKLSCLTPTSSALLLAGSMEAYVAAPKL